MAKEIGSQDYWIKFYKYDKNVEEQPSLKFLTMINRLTRSRIEHKTIQNGIVNT